MGSGLNIQPRPVVALPRKAGARRVQGQMVGALSSILRNRAKT